MIVMFLQHKEKSSKISAIHSILPFYFLENVSSSRLSASQALEEWKWMQGRNHNAELKRLLDELLNLSEDAWRKI